MGQSRIIIVDYGMGNLRSVQKAFEACGNEAVLSRDPAVVGNAGALVVPGVGAFGDCTGNLRRYGLIKPIVQHITSGKPYLGICLGLHILFTSSEESEKTGGLDIIPGTVKRFGGELKVPHMGWNTISFRRLHRGRGGGDEKEICPLFRGIEEGDYVYFVHSYFPEPEMNSVTAAVTEYGSSFVSAVWKDNIMATQFHPEKSQHTGLKMIRNFINLIYSSTSS